MSLEPDFPAPSALLSADTQPAGVPVQKISFQFFDRVLLRNGDSKCECVSSPAPGCHGELVGNLSKSGVHTRVYCEAAGEGEHRHEEGSPLLNSNDRRACRWHKYHL